jgi:hypothetical protein
MTACTPKEELEWRCRLDRQFTDRDECKETNWFSWLSLDIKSLGTVFGKPGMMVLPCTTCLNEALMINRHD